MTQSHKTASEYSDSKYLFILFALIFVVLFFIFLIYFIYGQKQFAPKIISGETQNIEELRRTNNLTVKNIPSPVVVPEVNQNIDINRYNPRDTETLSLKGKALLEKYFSFIGS